jgi:hypothetical protein
VDVLAAVPAVAIVLPRERDVLADHHAWNLDRTGVG